MIEILDTTSIVFTKEELWLLHKCIRHELPNLDQMKNPPFNYELNEAISTAILFCHENEVDEAALILNIKDLLAIDSTTPQDAKSSNGALIGKNILLKTFKGRKELRGEEYNSSIEVEQTFTKQEITDAMIALEEKRNA